MANEPERQNNLPGNELPENIGEGRGLFQDPDYLALMENYQQARFEVCSRLLAGLMERYPEHRRLIEFKKDLDLQLSLKSLEVKHLKEEKQNKTRKTIKLSFFTIFSVVIVFLIFIGSYFVFSQLFTQQVSKTSLEKISGLEQQANNLLIAGKPQVAADLVAQIRAIDPQYAGLESLDARTNELLELETRYNEAVSLHQAGQYAEALLILQEIETRSPGLWDVRKLIQQSETGIKISEFLETGDQAYQAADWQAAIEAYEAALALNPDLENSVMKEQLLNSYLRRIIEMMESSTTTIEDIEVAEQYYRKAVAMIPQSKAFASERGNLQMVSSNLLELKFTQTANTLLQERYQTFASITSAVNYLNKAVNLNPKNSQLQQDLKNAQLYQVAFQNVIELNWSQAINNLSQLTAVDPNFANGNARQLLYEAYYSLGKQYLAVGLYPDARSNLEQAEILAFDAGNKLQLFQVQTALGETIAKTGDFQNAATYYQYAFNRVNVYGKVPITSDLYALVSEAEAQFTEGNYQRAVESYQQAGKLIGQIYKIKTITAPDGATLPFFAADHQSSTEAIIAANNLPQSMTITFGRDLQVPVIE